MNPTIHANSAAVVELEMDMQVKSEPESEDDSMKSNISVTSSVEEVWKTLPSPSDEDELEDEPLVEIESIMVPQELVEVELEPTLLLFVNKDPKKSDPGRIITRSYGRPEKSLITNDDKYIQSDTVNKKLSITKVLRSVKRKQNCNFPNYSLEKTAKPNKKKNTVLKTKILDSKLSNVHSEASSLGSGCSFEADSVSTESPTIKLKNLIKRVKISKKKVHKVMKTKLKPRCSKEKIREESSAKILTNELNINKLSCPKEESAKLTYHTVKDLKGKENAQCNNEDENTADDVSSSKQCKLKRKEVFISDSVVREEISKPNSYDCMVCGKQFREKSHLATHARAHIDIRNFKCNECGLRFKTKTNLYYHTKTHEAPFTCTKCNKTFLQKKVFTRHMRVVHSGEGLYNCDICGRPFKSAQNLELHYTLHTGNKPFSCSICCKSFVYKSTYRAHMKAHEADEQFSCEVCLAAGPQDKGELRRRCHHYSQARPWLCTVCGKGYPLKATLKNHMKSHEAEKPFKCEECGKYFMKRQTYECHLKTHSGEKPQYMCDQCSQSYFSFVSLKRHYMKHVSERKFICDLCNKAFWTKDAMKVHRRSHENIKMFQCTQCSKAFAHKHTLVAHLRTHSGEHLHSCEICCKTFLHKYHLTRHQRQHSTPFPPPTLPITPSLYMLPPHNHLDMPTLQIL